MAGRKGISSVLGDHFNRIYVLRLGVFPNKTPKLFILYNLGSYK